MLYPKNKQEFSKELFKNPTAEYRATPFWAWNSVLREDELLREIEYMKEMGMGGFHMHSRAGMSTKYLSDDFMALTRACCEKAKREKMLTWLYDEDKWPSGFAGGYVTKKPENRMKYLLFTPVPYGVSEIKLSSNSSGRVDSRSENGVLLARYDVKLDDVGDLVSYKRLSDGECGENVWYAYLESSTEKKWFNYQTYVDTLSKSAIDDFINITHERYKEVLGDEFGKNIPAIFTDEPQVTWKSCLDFGNQKKDVVLPFTTDFDESFIKTYGYSVLDKFPEVIWDNAEADYRVRYNYHDHATERFAEAFADNIGSWCRENGIMLTGHMMQEPTLKSQSGSVGEAMRSYRSFGLPGVDMLCDAREFTTVKQTASATHQYGYPGVLSELYGVTNWDFDFRGHKLQGDWQAALGVTVRVPHLYWVSMRGEAKRDYPASIGHQSSWYKEYSFIEDHFARVNTLMTRGEADVKIAVIHPIESYWLHYGPNDRTYSRRAQLDTRFSEITSWLLHATLDFDFVSESLLPSQYVKDENGFRIGKMCYSAVIVPACETIRKTTLDALREYATAGGKVIFMGETPTLVDAAPSEEPAALAEKCIRIGWDKETLVNILEDERCIKVIDKAGIPAENVIYGMRRENGAKYLFLSHVYDCSRGSVPKREQYTVTVKGIYAPTLMNTENGDMTPLHAEYENGNTVIDWRCYSQSSLLLMLKEGKSCALAPKDEDVGELSYLTDECEIELHEPNVCVLDIAKWRLDSGEWQPADEMIRIASHAKDMLGMRGTSTDGAQPWVFELPPAKNKITVEAEIYSEIEIEGAELAIEDLSDCEILLNGEPQNKTETGYYVDFSIKKIALGKIRRGKNTVTVTKPFNAISYVENMFILGDFGVRVIGNSARICEPVRHVRFGDLASQGLAFYGGALTYKVKLPGGKDTSLSLGLFAAGAVTAQTENMPAQNISLAPHTVRLGTLPEGENTVSLNVYLSRINTFGTFHNSNYDTTWFGPAAWSTEGEDYSYEYRLEKTGLLTAPRIYRK